MFSGSFTAVVTPLKNNKVDFDAYKKIIDMQIEAGITGIVPCGSTGESATLSHAEHDEVIQKAVEFSAGKLKVIAGTGSNDTAYCVDLSKRAEKLGADALLVVTPYYNKCTQEGLYRNYKAVAEAVSCPIILYNVPSRTNVNISPELLLRLSDCENIIGVKECNFGQVPEIFNLCGDRYAMYSGEDGLAVPMVSLGAKGVISVVANILPREMSQMIHSYIDGDIQKARDMQISMIPLVKALFCEVNPIPVKEALNMLGWNAGPCRLPLCEMSAANHKKMEEVLAKYDTSATAKFLAK